MPIPKNKFSRGVSLPTYLSLYAFFSQKYINVKIRPRPKRNNKICNKGLPIINLTNKVNVCKNILLNLNYIYVKSAQLYKHDTLKNTA